MAIETQYIEISELRNWFTANRESLFNSLLVTKRNLDFGTADGKVRTGSIAPIYAITSQIQYYLKLAGVTVVSWWYVQHIIIAYLRETILQGKTVSALNYNDFVTPLKAVKTDQGKTAFSESDIIQVLQAINKFKSDELVSILAKFISGNNSNSNINNNSNVIIDNKSIDTDKINNTDSNIDNGVVIPSNKTQSAGSGLMIGACVLGAVLLMGKKGKKR